MHNQWNQTRKLRAQGGDVTEHESLCEVIEALHEYDQPNVKKKIRKAREERALLKGPKNEDVKK